MGQTRPKNGIIVFLSRSIKFKLEKNNYFSGQSNEVAMQYLKKSIKFPGYPTMVFYRGNGVAVIGGVPARLAEELSHVTSWHSSNLQENVVKPIDFSNVVEFPLTKKNYTIAKNSVYIYAEPSEQSLKLVKLTDGFSIIPEKLIQLPDKSRWIEFQVLENNLCGWARLDDFK